MAAKTAYVILFIAWPLLEIALLIKAGQWLGFWPVIGLVVLTAIAGVLIIRLTGIAVMRRMLAGELSHNPAASMVDSSAVMMAAGLLILPGLLGDCLGLLLLIPPVRSFVIARIFPLAGGASNSRMFRTRRRPGHPPRPERDPQAEPSAQPRSPRPRPTRDGGPVIEGEFERLSERPIKPRDTEGRRSD